MEQTKYDVFISYSRKDYVDEHKNVIPGNEVSRIKDALTEAGITYWFDEEGIYSGQNFVEKIVTNIENAKVFLFLSTANSNKSPWTCKEIASADEFKKHIIPVRIDSAPYNKKVLFRIADLDYIEYYTNPEKGMTDLIKSIKTFLEQLQMEEKRKKEEEERQREMISKKQEEEKRQKEQEEKCRKEEQQKIVSDIKLKCAALNNEETKIGLDRATLLLSAEKVTDEEERNSLISFIQNSSPAQKKCQAEIDVLREKNEEWRKKTEMLKGEMNAALSSIQEMERELRDRIDKEMTLNQEKDRLTNELRENSESISQLKKKLEQRSDEAYKKSIKRLKIGIIILGMFSLVLSVVSLRQLCISKEIASSAQAPAGLNEGNTSNKHVAPQQTTRPNNIPIKEESVATPEVENEKELRAVDLGLSVKWANLNVGASSSFSIGSYFAWGEISAKPSYNRNTYKYYKDGSYTLIGEVGEVETGHSYYNIGGTEYDAASQNQGKKWRMPTETECLELKNKCKWTWNASKSGYIVTGPNGNNIFLPATGCMSDAHVAFLHTKAKKGFYWSSKTANTSQYGNGEYASALQFDPNSSERKVVTPIDRVYGRCIRAVCE